MCYDAGKRKERYECQKIERLAAGICVSCGKNPVVDGRLSCEICLEKAKENTTTRAKERKKTKICVECGINELTSHSTHCEICLPKYKKRRKNLSEKRKISGICTNCGCRPAIDSKTLCEICLNKLKINSKELAKKRKELGLCRCGNVPKTGKALCEKCLQVNVDRRAKSLKNGICTRCHKNKLIPGKRWCEGCRVKRKADMNNRRKMGICIRTGCKNTAINAVECDCCKEKRKNRHRELKQEVLNHYGQRCNCSCGCNVTNFNHLTIDHINNDGAKHRKDLGINAGRAFLAWIIRNNFPDDLQILCWNCNCAKEYYGGCKCLN